MLEPFNQDHMVQIHLTCEVTRGRAVTSFESPVALFYTPITSMLLCGRILPTTGNFTQSTKGKSSISSVVPGVTVYSLETAQIGGTTTLLGGMPVHYKNLPWTRLFGGLNNLLIPCTYFFLQTKTQWPWPAHVTDCSGSLPS